MAKNETGQILITAERLALAIEKEAYGGGEVVIIKRDDWRAIADAYHSPLTQKIGLRALRVLPIRHAETKRLVFTILPRK